MTLESGKYFKSLKDLLKGTTVNKVIGRGNPTISCLISDSRRVIPGALFFAIKGINSNGNLYVEEAIGRGAVAVVSDEAPSSFCPFNYIHVPNARIALAEIAKSFYNSPDEKLDVIGITGTNGKTTVTNLVQYFLKSTNIRTGLIGTNCYDIGERTLPSYRTTPEVADVYAMMDQMVVSECKAVSMEVTSHALDQLRVYGVKIDIAAFLNLTQDHIDYHNTFDEYFDVKSKLFTGEVNKRPRVAVINIDESYGQELVKRIPNDVKVITYGFSEKADVRAGKVDLKPNGSVFDILWDGKKSVVETLLVGKYNVSNLLASFAICKAKGISIENLIEKVPFFKGVKGRMESVKDGLPYQIYVDYAHTSDALKNVLTMLKEVTPGRIFVVFGCGGNRDTIKRPQMTTIAQQLADYVWVTTDNPRKESIESIFGDMRKGVIMPEKISFVRDRKRAISLAIDEAQEGDCVLIAGKGHETFQEFADTVISFDDCQVARELIRLKEMRTVELCDVSRC